MYEQSFMINILCFNTRLGWITLKENEQKLVSIKFGKKINQGNSKFLIKAKKQISGADISKLKGNISSLTVKLKNRKNLQNLEALERRIIDCREKMLKLEKDL